MTPKERSISKLNINKETSRILRLVSCCFFAYTVISHFITMQTLPLFGDDYYYATFFSNGFSGFISETVRHYTEVNGRALIHFIDELLLLDRSLTLWSIFAAATISALIFFSAKIGAMEYKERNAPRFYLSLIFVCFGFCTLSPHIARVSVFWATGTLNYLFPATVLIIFSYYALKAIEKGNKGWENAVMIISGFVTSASVEQAAGCSLCVALYVSATSFIRKQKPKKALIAADILMLIGISTLLFAPGVGIRMNYYPDFYSLSLFGKIKLSFLPLFVSNIGETGYQLLTAALFLLIPAALYIKEKSISKKEGAGIKPLSSILLLGSSVLPFLSYCLYSTGTASKWIFMYIFGVFGGAAMIISAIFAVKTRIKENSNYLLEFFLLAVASQAVMLVSPEIGPRTAFFGFALLLPVGGGCFSSVVSALKAEEGTCKCERKIKSSASALMLLLVIAISLTSLTTTMIYHAKNAEVYAMTEAAMAELPENYTSIPFYMPVHYKYRYTLPFDNPSYHAAWYKICHGLDPQAEFEYIWVEN